MNGLQCWRGRIWFTAALLRHTLIAEKSPHVSTKIVGIKRETIDLNAAPGMHRTTTQAFGWLASKCAAKATKFAAFFVGSPK